MLSAFQLKSALLVVAFWLCCTYLYFYFKSALTASAISATASAMPLTAAAMSATAAESSSAALATADAASAAAATWPHTHSTQKAHVRQQSLVCLAG
jgi:hypothetical protein